MIIMRKKIASALLLFLALGLFLSGCSTSGTTDTANETADTAENKTQTEDNDNASLSDSGSSNRSSGALKGSHTHDWVATYHEATGHYETIVTVPAYDEQFFNGMSYEIVHHDAVTTQQWVQDSPAYTTYTCSICGATK